MALLSPAQEHNRSLTPSPEPPARDLAQRHKEIQHEEVTNDDYYNYSHSSASFFNTGKSPDNMFLSVNQSYNIVLYVLKELHTADRMTVKSIQRAYIHGICGNGKQPHAFGATLDTSIYAFSKVCTSVFRMVGLRAMNINEKLWPAVSSPCDKRNYDILRYEQIHGPPVVVTQTYSKARRIWCDLDRLYPHFSIEMCAEDLLDKKRKSMALDSSMIMFRRHMQEVVEVTMTVDMEKGPEKIYNCDVCATICKRSIAEGPDGTWMSTLKLLMTGPTLSIKKHYQNIKTIGSNRDTAVECVNTYFKDLPDTLAPAEGNTTIQLQQQQPTTYSKIGSPLATSSTNDYQELSGKKEEPKEKPAEKEDGHKKHHHRSKHGGHGEDGKKDDKDSSSSSLHRHKSHSDKKDGDKGSESKHGEHKSRHHGHKSHSDDKDKEHGHHSHHGDKDKDKEKDKEHGHHGDKLEVGGGGHGHHKKHHSSHSRSRSHSHSKERTEEPQGGADDASLGKASDTESVKEQE